MADQNQTDGSYRGIILTYVGLLLLLTASVTQSVLDLGVINLWAPLGIALVQAALVVFLFMHMRQERRLWKIYLLMVLAVVAFLIGFTLFDILYRYR
jgi:cytochrome c oxidase subunit 4